MMPRTKTGTPRKAKYKPILKLPPLPPEQYEALRDNIAVNGVLVPILVDGDGPLRGIIDGNNRKAIADELGYECPEIVQGGLEEEEKRTLARALNLARRQLNPDQKRAVIADQLKETPERSNRWIGKMLGVSHPTVASVRAELASTGKAFQLERTVGQDGKYRPVAKALKAVERSAIERTSRIEAATLIHGDCRNELRKIASKTADAVICDPIYPEVRREYGRISEPDWHDLMKEVVRECRRVLKPKGSAVFILQPNYDKIGKMRLWLWEFVVWAAKEWNLVQDAYWWCIDAMPLAGTQRTLGLMRQSVKWCVWLGPADCYRNQDAVLWTSSQANLARNRADMALRTGPSGRTFRNGTVARAAEERGGVTPFNLLPIPTGGQPGGAEHHPAATPYELAAWWCRYILPPGGVLLDPFCGSGTMLAAGLDHGASRVIGIEKEKKYLKTAERRIRLG
jgi:predicted methyltransferase